MPAVPPNSRRASYSASSRTRFWRRSILVKLLVCGLLISGTQGQLLEAADRDALLDWKPLRNWLASYPERAGSVETVIQTDRPSFTAASTLVPTGWVQLESGYQFTHNREGSRLTNSHGAPQLSLRLGLADWLEWRTLWGGVITNDEHTRANRRDYSTTSDDLQTGVKLRTSKANGWVPESALIAILYLPTGYGDLSKDRVAPALDYIYTWSITEIWSFTGSTGVVLGRHGDRGSDEWFQTLVLGQQWSDQLSTYGEWYVIDTRTAQGNSTPQTMDAGILWRPRANIQFDWRVGFGLNRSADDFFTGVGFSARH